MMLDAIVYIVTNLFQVYLLLSCTKLFFEEKTASFRKEFAVYSIFYVINTVLYLCFHSPLINIAENLLGIALFAALYTRSVKKILFITGIVYGIAICCDSLAVLPFVDYQIGGEVNQLYTVITVFLLLICRILLEKILSFGKKNTSVQNLPLLVVPFCSIGLFCFLAFGGKDWEVRMVGTSIGLLVINFLVLYLYNLLLKALAQKYENEILEQRMHVYQNQFEIIQESADRARALRHDMKNHLLELKIMADKYHVSELQDYITDMKDFLDNPDEIVSSGNREIDSVLNYQLLKAKNTLKQVNVKVSLPEEISHSFDVNTILGNLLENAIEAASMTKEQSLKVLIQYEKEVLHIAVTNSYNGNLLQDNGMILTTKKDLSYHGIGLKNVRKIVKKYNGDMEIIPKDKDFCVEIMLYL